jgi:integrase
MPYPEKRGKGAGAYYRARYKRSPGQSDGVVKDLDGRTVRYPTKREAIDAAISAEADYRAGRLVERAKPDETPEPEKPPTTVGQWYRETWRPAQEYDSINTEQTYDGHWKRYIEPRWGSTPIAEIRPIHLQAWENELRKRLSRSSVISIMAPFRRMLEDAFANRVIDFSPVPPPRRRSKKNKYQSKGVAVPLATWEEILAGLRPEDALLARVVYFTGMRWSEVAAMRRRFLTLTPAGDGHPAAGIYYLHPDVGAVHEDVAGRRHYGSPKSGPGREFDLPPFLVEMLLEHLAQLPAPGRDVHADDADLLFPDYAGRPHNASNWGKRWAVARHPIWPGLRLHDGKHSHGALLDDAGTHRVMREYRLGHDDGSTRAIYEHPTPAMRRKLIIDLEAAWQAYRASVVIHSQPTPGDLFAHTASEGIDIVRPGGTPQASLF